MKILIVEDEADVAEIVQETLEALGGHCVRAADAAEADRALVSEHLDAVTLDLGLGDHDGLAWLERLAYIRPELANRTLVITGRPLGADSVTRLARCGAGLLAKPFTVEGLTDAVRAQIEHALRFSGN